MIAHLASTTDAGPLLRTLHPILTPSGIWFHGRANGTKAKAIGRAGVAQMEEVICRIPSYVFDPARAGPATTWYTTAVWQGTLEAMNDPDEKAALLQGMMEVYQPEGRHVPITAGDPRYRQSVANLLIFGIRGAPERTMYAGQNKPAEVRLRVLDHLWAQGQTAAIDQLRALHPDLPDPTFLRSPVRLYVHPDTLIDGLADAYWNEGIPVDRLRTAHQRASAWVVAREGGRVVASARALADGSKYAWVYDVFVSPEWRGRGLGEAVMRTLLDHAAVRDCARVFLATKDAEAFYRRLGFIRMEEGRKRPYPSIQMVLERDRPIGPVV